MFGIPAFKKWLKWLFHYQHWFIFSQLTNQFIFEALRFRALRLSRCRHRCLNSDPPDKHRPEICNLSVLCVYMSVKIYTLKYVQEPLKKKKKNGEFIQFCDWYRLHGPKLCAADPRRWRQRFFGNELHNDCICFCWILPFNLLSQMMFVLVRSGSSVEGAMIC